MTGYFQPCSTLAFITEFANRKTEGLEENENDKRDVVKTDDDVEIPAIYAEYLDVFAKKGTDHLPPHRDIDLAIDIKPGAQLPHGRIYNLIHTEIELASRCADPVCEEKGRRFALVR